MKASTRFVPHVVVLALLAGAGAWNAWLSDERADPCLHPDVLSVTGLIPGSQPEGERRDRVVDDIVQWSEGLISDPDRPREPMIYRMVRSYSALKMAERPLGLMPSKVEAETIRLEQVDAVGGPLPIHVVRTTGAATFQLVAYLYVFGNEPVTHPFTAQLRGAWRDLGEGRRPLTVILAGGTATPQTAEAREELALRWIDAAWQHYRSMCLDRPGSRAS